MNDEITAKLRINKTVVDTLQTKSWTSILIVCEYPSPEVVTIRLYDLVFECHGERVNDNPMNNEFYFDFVGVQPHK